MNVGMDMPLKFRERPGRKRLPCCTNIIKIRIASGTVRPYRTGKPPHELLPAAKARLRNGAAVPRWRWKGPEALSGPGRYENRYFANTPGCPGGRRQNQNLPAV